MTIDPPSPRSEPPSLIPIVGLRARDGLSLVAEVRTVFVFCSFFDLFPSFLASFSYPQGARIVKDSTFSDDSRHCI